MQLKPSNLRKYSLSLALCLVVGFVVSVFVMRTGASMLLPQPVFDMAFFFVSPASQEEVANIEFLVVWFLSFLVLAVFCISAFALFHRGGSGGKGA